MPFSTCIPSGFAEQNDVALAEVQGPVARSEGRLNTDLHEDRPLQRAACALTTAVLRRPVTRQQQKVHIREPVVLCNVQQLKLDIAIPAFCIVPVNDLASNVYLARQNLHPKT